MELKKKFLEALQNRLKVGNRRGVHLNAIPGRSRLKFDISRLSHIDEKMPQNFIEALLSELPLKFKISWKDLELDFNEIIDEEKTEIVKITKSLEGLINQTNDIESERGVNTFGFGFPVLVRRDQSDNQLTAAPILIWSLKIKRSKEFNTWEIHRTDEDPIYINEVLINHLQSDSNVEIEKISTEQLDDGLIDKEELLDICEKIINSINTNPKDDLREKLKSRLSNIKKIEEKKYYESLPLSSASSHIEFGGLFSIFEVQKQKIIEDYSRLLQLEGLTIDVDDMDNYEFQSITSIETDPSQQSILNSLEKSRNIVIQGPPGTGKSQSLSAILLNALENNKKTIVVCEKRTALEVLHESLIEKDLSSQCVLIKDTVKDRKSAVNSVRDRIDSKYTVVQSSYSNTKQQLEHIIDSSERIIKSLNSKHLKLDEKILGDKNWTSVVGYYLSELKNHVDETELNLKKERFKFNNEELTHFIDLIKKSESLYKLYEPFDELSFLSPSKFSTKNQFSLEQNINNDFKEYAERIVEIDKLLDKIKDDYTAFRKDEFSKSYDLANSIIKKCLAISSKHSITDDFYNDEKSEGIFYKIGSLFSKQKKQIVDERKQFNSLFDELTTYSNNHYDLKKIANLKNTEENIKLIHLFTEQLEISKKELDNAIEIELEKIPLYDFPRKFENSAIFQEINEKLKSLDELIIENDWLGKPLDDLFTLSRVSSIKNIIETKTKYFREVNDIFTKEFNWFSFYNELQSNSLDKEVIDALAQQKNWLNSFLVYYLNELLISSANSQLPIDERELTDLKNTMKSLRYAQISYIKKHWEREYMLAERNFKSKNPNLTVANLYNKRSSTKHRRLSLREIIKMDPDLFTTFFPIVLTTPNVASNLFNGYDKYFDIVMFDEASQLKVEDNLPALLKGKQIVIAGDEHQMPPSTYFAKMLDGDYDEQDEEEDEIERIKNTIADSLLDCESLLEFANELGFDKRYLDFHYRSKHPYLIDFSNYAFYNQRLKPLPKSSDYTPITYINVDGTYYGNTNDSEAERVINIIDKNVVKNEDGKYPSVGVATFNIPQRNLILSKINDRRKHLEFKDFNDKIIELEADGFFVKNLENIQGDERDIIIMSTTYGINPDGKFQQRFGSINQSKGYKLLNVIVTRAKYKMYVCSSIPQEKFLNFKDHLVTEGSNNRRGVFYAYLTYAKAVSENNEDLRNSVLNALSENSEKSEMIDTIGLGLESPFEEEVYEELVQHLNKENILIQHKFAGFRIDMVYDSKIKDIPKIAIECDGANYHSSQEAYLAVFV